MAETEEKGAMQAEKLFAVLQAHSCTQSCRMKSDSWGKSPLPTTSRAHQEGAAAAGSVVQVRSKTTIGRGTECRGQIQDLHRPESWVQQVPSRGRTSPHMGSCNPLGQGAVGHQVACSSHKHIKADPWPSEC